MKCPFCSCEESKVIDSRPTDEGERIRRRRECTGCGKRFTTYEVIESVPVEEKTKSGLYLTAASQEKPQAYTVVAVGPGGIIDGKEIVMHVKVGDKVITTKYSGTEVKLDGEEYTIVRQADILAIVE